MFQCGAGPCMTMSENAKNGSREIATNGGLMNASYANRAIRAIEDRATETAVSENAVIANVDLAAIAVKGEIAARVAAVVADPQHRNGKDQQFDKCILRRVRSQPLRTQSRVRRARATRSRVPSPPLGGGSHEVR
jgi:hypothetical protein